MRYIYFLAMFVALVSCKKAEDRRCMKGAGALVTIERSVATFDRIFVGPNMYITLVQDSLDFVKITAGENLVNFITSDIIDGQLRIENTNKCNFLRSYKHQVNVEVHLTDLKALYFEGTKELNTLTPIVSNNLNVTIRDGAGTVNLDLACGNVQLVVTNGWGNFNLRGVTNTLALEIRSNGFGSTKDLIVNNKLGVVTASAGIVEVNASNTEFNAQIDSNGDIWYVGVPSVLNFLHYGTGALVDKN